MGLDPRKVTRQLPQVDMKKTCLRDGNDRGKGISWAPELSSATGNAMDIPSVKGCEHPSTLVLEGWFSVVQEYMMGYQTLFRVA